MICLKFNLIVGDRLMNLWRNLDQIFTADIWYQQGHVGQESGGVGVFFGGLRVCIDNFVNTSHFLEILSTHLFPFVV